MPSETSRGITKQRVLYLISGGIACLAPDSAPEAPGTPSPVTGSGPIKGGAARPPDPLSGALSRPAEWP